MCTPAELYSRTRKWMTAEGGYMKWSTSSCSIHFRRNPNPISTPLHFISEPFRFSKFTMQLSSFFLIFIFMATGVISQQFSNYLQTCNIQNQGASEIGGTCQTISNVANPTQLNLNNCFENLHGLLSVSLSSSFTLQTTESWNIYSTSKSKLLGVHKQKRRAVLTWSETFQRQLWTLLLNM